MAGATFIVWKDEYLVGHDELDTHHRRMFTIMNSLYHAMTTEEAKSQLTSLFQSALGYAHLHFQVEESVLRSAQYPHLTEQEKTHQAYVKKLTDLVQPFLGTPQSLSLDVLQFLKEWWFNHILKMDKAYAPFCVVMNRRTSAFSGRLA